MIEEAKRLFLANEPDAAHGLCVEILNTDPENVGALYMMGSIYAKAERYGLAYNVFKRVTEIAPKRAEAWNNLGMALEALDRYKDAKECFKKAAKLDPKNASYPANLAMAFLEDGDRPEAKRLALKALELDPANVGARSTLGFAQLGMGDWAGGWDNYRYTLGGKFRKVIQYGDEPLWDGAKNKKVVIYGEQGLGDEIMYASIIPDALKDCAQVTIDCDKRLEGLFRRSFPEARVYGTRRENEIEWEANADANCPMGLLPYFYRKSPKDCPKTPYLKADPERVLQWRTLFETYKKPVIGICWTGGSKHNHTARRDVGLEAFKPMFETVDAVFVSLQYKPCDVSGYPVKVFERAMLTPDYDDTAGLVAALDHVVGIHTAVHHLAGALGVPATILVPEKCSWAYALDEMPWYASKLFRQLPGEKWVNTIKRLCDSDFRRLR